jgi:hypothetical protein
MLWSNHHKCCSIYMYFLATCITFQSCPSFDLVQSPQYKIGLNGNTCGQEIHVNGTTLVVIGSVPFTCISWPHVLQFSPILVLIWSNHHKCCSTRTGLKCNTCGQEIHVNGTTLVVIGPNQI